MAAAAPVKMHRTLPVEEAARAGLYALLARLLYDGPDGALLRSIVEAEAFGADADPDLARAWNALAAASSAMDADAGAEEYDALFVGVGKAAVSLYAGYYTGAPALDHPRIRLQATLASMGLGRRPGANEPEDHMAALFDVMRVLIAGGAGRGEAPLDEQRRFFEHELAVAAPKFFSTVIASPRANYYRKVAAFGLAFVALEKEAFELE